MSYIGLDLGTSGLKGVVIDDDQAIVAEAVAEMTVTRPAEGWSEQDPADWIAALDTVMRALGGKTSLAGVQARILTRVENVFPIQPERGSSSPDNSLRPLYNQLWRP
mgnify:CR=1 FL=1